MIENCFSPAETVGQAGQADSTLLFRLLRGRGGRAVDRNGVRVRSMSEVVGGFRVVLFCPAHLSVVQGSPEDRRDFLNVAISQLRPVYVRALKRFNRALRERNALLRQAQTLCPEATFTLEVLQAAPAVSWMLEERILEG